MSSPDTRLVRLLTRGFYPNELPPPFRTRHFSLIRHTFTPPTDYHGSTTFFTGTNHRGESRTFGVVNPVSYFLLARFIANNWAEIKKTYAMSSTSGAVPRFPALGAGGRAIRTDSIAAKRKASHHVASTFPIVVELDINRFYGSIYTHAIPWAVLTKDTAKARHNAKPKPPTHWSETLDKLTRNCNDRQTVGIAIGPDTSRIISELLLSRIDADLAYKPNAIPVRQIYHNIDDYQIGAYDLAEAESVQASFVRTITQYELRPNDAKTAVRQGVQLAPSTFEPHFDGLEGKSGSSFVDLFFDILATQATRHPEHNVVGYELMLFASRLYAEAELGLVRDDLQRLLYASPHQARNVLPLLLQIYMQLSPSPDVKRLHVWGIRTCARRGDILGLLWFLYGAIFLGVKLDSATCASCAGLSSELVDTILFHGYDLGLFSVSATNLAHRYATADFRSPAWLPLYEIQRHGWSKAPAFAEIGSAQDHAGLYDQLRTADVQFYVSEPALFTPAAFRNWNIHDEQPDSANADESFPPIPPYD